MDPSGERPQKPKPCRIKGRPCTPDEVRFFKLSPAEQAKAVAYFKALKHAADVKLWNDTLKWNAAVKHNQDVARLNAAIARNRASAGTMHYASPTSCSQVGPDGASFGDCDSGQGPPNTRARLTRAVLERLGHTLFQRMIHPGCQQPPVVFLSYAWVDSALVNKIDQWLRGRGMRVLRDTREFAPGTKSLSRK
jgi:hypothetical protein